MQLGEKIRLLRAVKNWSQDELGERVGLTQDQVSKIERGLMKRVDVEMVKKLAEVFDVSISELFEENIVPSVIRPATKSSGSPGEKSPLRPVYAAVPAGKGELRDEPGTYEPAPQDVNDAGKGYWLRVKGSSMVPVFADGQLVFVNPEREVRHKDFAVVIWNEHTEGAIKQIFFSGDDVMLKSINPTVDPIMVSRRSLSMIARICYSKF